MYQFIGRFHPLLVHIPIGVLLLAFLLEYFIKKKNAAFSYAIEVTLLVGAVSAIIAASLGWLLSLSDEYDVALLNKHQWWGISLCIASLLLWVCKKFADTLPLLAKVYRPLFLLSILLLMITGHFGGSLTHGEDYLSFQSFLEETNKKKPDTVQKKIKLSEITPDLTVYKNLINPVFDAKCISCHNDKKKKGNFQMQTHELLLIGGKSKKKIINSTVQNSELIRRLLLDKDDDRHMPPKGKGQLTKSELDLIYWWVQTGASPEKKLIEVKTNDTIKAFFVNQEIKKTPSLHLQNVKEASATNLAFINSIHWKVNPISKGSSFLEISAINNPEFNETHKSILLKIAPQVAWLMLGNTKITDVGMQVIEKCTNIVKLNLQNTSITNAAIPSINKLSQLEYLNIVGTRINDAGLLQLQLNKSLKRIFCWNSQISKTGVEKFKKINPSIEIEYFSKN